MARRRPQAPPAPAGRPTAPAADRRGPTGPANGHVARRGELMAEIFLEKHEPAFLARGDFLPVTFLAGFRNEAGGLNHWPVQVVSTADPVGEAGRATLPAAEADRLARSSPPALLLVADALRTELFYAWPADLAPQPPAAPGARDGVREIPVRLVKPDEAALLARLTAPPAEPAKAAA